MQNVAHSFLPALKMLRKLPCETVLEEGTLVQTDYLSMHIPLVETWPYIVLAFEESPSNCLLGRGFTLAVARLYGHWNDLMRKLRRNAVLKVCLTSACM